MFGLSVIDQVRLNSGHVERNYTVHARAAERLARLAFNARIALLALGGLATALVALAAYRGSRETLLAAVVASAVAWATAGLYVALNLESRVSAHRTFAHRLWIIAERHHSLLAEIHDRRVDDAAVLRRREELMAQVHAVYEQTFAPDQVAYETLRAAGVQPGGATAPPSELTGAARA